MRTRTISILLGLLVVTAVWRSMREEERFAVENPHLEPVAGGTRVVGTLVNQGEAAPLVKVEVSVIAADGRPAEKETVELRDVAAGARTPFATPPHPGEVKSYSIYVNQGRNPYGN
jgi:hypothetical protein